jgi:hypothetical protein
MIKLRIRMQFLRFRRLDKGYVNSIIIVARHVAKFNSHKGMTLRGLPRKALDSAIVRLKTLVFFRLFQAIPGQVRIDPDLRLLSKLIAIRLS